MDSTANLCMSCMTHGMRHNGTLCGNCGVDEKNLRAATHHLKPRTLLNNKYLIGRVIGEGGFGITYLGWDTALSVKIAVKEYYPSGFVTRDTTNSAEVRSLGGGKGEFFAQGRNRFINEARRLAKFFGMPGIVSVKDFFEGNGTAYIIMEYLEGATMRTVLTNMGERMPEKHVLEIMKPLVRSLAEMHRTGLIHRDIAPDNIMILPDGSVKLLDFGAAREVFTDGQSTAAVMKHGYSPEEQYDTDHARQGPWTDVYALCATIFRAIEGDTPPDAISRLRNDVFSGFTVPVSDNTQRAVMKGLALAPEKRWQDVGELWRELYPTSSPVATSQTTAFQSEPVLERISLFPRMKLSKKLVAMIGGAAAVIALVVLAITLFGNSQNPSNWSASESTRGQIYSSTQGSSSQGSTVSIESDYEEAVDLFERMEYSEAYMAFQALGSYMDSEDRMNESRYCMAVQLLDEKDYSGAREHFGGLGGYGNSAEMMLEVDYRIAYDLFEEKKFSAAYNAFNALGDYSNSKEMLLEVRYGYGVELLNSGDYEGAIERFVAVGNYKDSANLLKESRYLLAEKLFGAGNYSAALDLYTLLAGYRNSAALADAVKAYVYDPSTMSISGHTLPPDQYVGAIFGVRGVIQSNYRILSVTVAVYNDRGVMETGKTVRPGTYTYDIRALDYDILFDILSPGYKTYVIESTDEMDTRRLEHTFWVNRR